MAIYFDGATTGFYDDTVHELIPAGAVEITAAEYQALMGAQESGQAIVDDGNGNPIAQDYTFTAAELKEQTKGIANVKIIGIASEWKQRNMIARSLELEREERINGPLAAPEQAEFDAMTAVWDRIKLIRAHSDTIEAAIDVDINTDINAGWPE